MLQPRLAQEELYLKAFDSSLKNGAGQAPEWIRELRERAIAQFKLLGFPTARRGNEEWKYTDVGPLARIPFHPVTTIGLPSLASQELKDLTLGHPEWPRIVFVDGAYSDELSSLASLPAGVSVINLAQAMMTRGNQARQHLGRYAQVDNNAFAALNMAFLQEGAFVHVPDGTVAGEPIHLLFLYTGRETDTVTHPRILVLTGKDSKATIIESYASLSPHRYFTNAVTEIVVGPGTAVKYYKLQQQSPVAYHITNTHVFNSRNGSFTSVNLDLGGGLVRNNLNLLMGEEGCSCTLNGLYVLGGTQHTDNQVIIDHASSYTTASELYKGILNDESHSVFHGSIIVREGIHKVNANQVDKNLLLSDRAEADTKPAFWIYSDDVRCGHGAACGQMDENALFYLRSRGMEEQAARRMLVRAFASDVMDGIEDEALRSSLDQLVQTKLDQWFKGDEIS